MRLVVVAIVLSGCTFELYTQPPVVADAPVAMVCPSDWFDAQWKHRFPVMTDADYVARLDAAPVLAVSLPSGDDIRVVRDTVREHALDGGALELAVTMTGQTWIYTGNPAAPPPGKPASLYAFSRSFDDNSVAGFAPETPADWSIFDDNGNRVYRVIGAGRHPNPLSAVPQQNVEVRARIRVGPGGGQNHNGLLVHASNTVPATLDGFVGQLLEDSEYSRIAEYQDGVSPPVERGTQLRPVDRATWYAMRMKSVGNTIELYVDNVLEVSTTMGANTGSIYGLFAHDTDVDYDDVRVRILRDPEPAITLGPRQDLVCN